MLVIVFISYLYSLLNLDLLWFLITIYCILSCSVNRSTLPGDSSSLALKPSFMSSKDDNPKKHGHGHVGIKGYGKFRKTKMVGIWYNKIIKN